MFDVGAPELLVLVVIAVILFGPEKLPEFARKAARVIKYVRSMAGNAQEQLSKELGPEFSDLDVRDLNPKTFIQKHLMDDVDPIVADVKKEITDSTAAGRTAAADVTAADGGRPRRSARTNGSSVNGDGQRNPGGPGADARSTPTRRERHAAAASATGRGQAQLTADQPAPPAGEPLRDRGQRRARRRVGVAGGDRYAVVAARRAASDPAAPDRAAAPGSPAGCSGWRPRSRRRRSRRPPSGGC